MLGTGLQFGGVRGEDRFYMPVKARKNQNHNKQVRRVKNDETESPDSSAKSKIVTSENRNSNGPSNTILKPSSPPVMHSSNIDKLLEFTTPLVPARYISKTTMRGWRTCDIEYQSYFTLNDLWESFKEWSVYGAGVPVVLDNNESVVQYYVPYLSGIQLYGEHFEKSNAKSRCTGEDSDGDYYRDTSSDGSSDYEFGKSIRPPRAQGNRLHLTGEIPSRMGRLSLSDKHSAVPDEFSSDDGEAGNSQGLLLLEFFEQDRPYIREPLTDKILDLACKYPGLKALRSCDLLPASWMSVAWYPIYRIPTGPTLKDLDACFLTYHSLSTPTTGSGGTQAPVLVYPNELDGIPKISLPAFGMASYKLKGFVWTQNGASESELANSLLQAADNWLRLLHVNHPDYHFFTTHGTYHG
ncbi:Protein of unknown function (DUF789) [Quillaja saponaria]|uniref:Uncharacterized protein n=1 Tax=Quillaja saponaria TaxID=32244 RepID=A0AAD7Q5E2_QUISA|nr:Protein of unknown function (DUF789) [Quillaja saponaria]